MAITSSKMNITPSKMNSGSSRSLAVFLAFSVTIFVFIPSLKNELWREFEVTNCNPQSTNNVQTTQNNAAQDWDISEIPMMRSKDKGFRPIYIYAQVPFEERPTYSQDKQDKLILALTKAENEKNSAEAGGEGESKAPYFMDLAANDPTILSNSYLLEKNGWEGVCIEPNPRYWYRLASLRTCTIVGAFVAGPQEEDGKEVSVNLSNARKGGIVGDGMDNKKAEQKRNLVSFLTILEQTGAPKVIDYFSLDVEGAETLVMQNFPWDVYTFKFITIERPKDDLKMMLQMHGYKLARTITSYDETLWINEEKVSLSEEEIDKIAESVGVKKY